MQIAIVNESTLLKNENFQPVLSALSVQMSQAAIAWSRDPASLVLRDAKSVDPTTDSPILVVDDADQADALGYHDETPDGHFYGRVFVGPVFDQGGDFCKSSGAVSTVISHEMLEMWGDAACNLWADVNGYEYALELADAVEGDSYMISGVAVSNFVLPAYFDSRAAGPFDCLKRLKRCAPAMTPGGYVIRRREGKIRAIYGYRHNTSTSKFHAASRTSRRGVFE